MGLDTIELAMEIEECFDIRIPDAEASEVRTVGDAHELILRRLGVPASAGCTGCVTAKAFYRLRRALVELVGARRGAIAPSTRLNVAVPLHRRRSLWPALSDRLALSMPPLGRGKWFTHLLLVGGVAAFFGGVIAGGWFWPGLWAGYSPRRFWFGW